MSVPFSLKLNLVVLFKRFTAFFDYGQYLCTPLSYLTNDELGIINEWPVTIEQPNYRSLWAKLGSRTRGFVNEEGVLSYFVLKRMIVGSAVTEFFNDNGNLGLILFGGGAAIQRELFVMLESKFGLRNLTPQNLTPEDIRKIFEKYWRRIKKIQIDPSLDFDWGGTRDAKLLSSRGQYIDVEAAVLKNIRKNHQILILGFKSDHDNLIIDGMKKPTNVRFELSSTSVKISTSEFQLEDAAIPRGEEIFYDFARDVYFKVAGDNEWVSNVTEVRSPVQMTLSMFEEDNEDAS